MAMSGTRGARTRRARTERARAAASRFRKLVAGGVAGALIGGTLVAAGVGAQLAVAAQPAPRVEATAGTALAGEDLTVSLRFASDRAAGDEFNLSAGLVLPADVAAVDTGTLGSASVHAAGEVLRGAYTQRAVDCAALGLEAAPEPPGPANACRVPEGRQYLVFANVSDLPEGAEATHELRLRPRAAAFPVGSSLDLVVTAFTSADERFVPAFPGSTGVAGGAEHTSEPGVDRAAFPIGAVRIEKREPSPESELLRGVHGHTTTYTLRVFHSAEGDVADTRVVDYLPAGLEYLGLGGIDHTTDANGTRGEAAEYPGAPGLDATPAPAGDNRAWPAAGEESVTTVIPTPEEVERYGLAAGQVYTRVEWSLGTVLAQGEPRDTAAGTPQAGASAPGSAGYFELHYRAAVPLFENTLDFGYAADATGQQAANLDNNRGPSTRHGLASAEHRAQALTNRAAAEGRYAGPLASGGSAVTRDTTGETVDAVDVRLLKRVNGGSATASFDQGRLARYTLSLATSEYVGADLSAGPRRLVDDLANGICPVFPVGTPVTDGASAHAGLPNLAIGDPGEGALQREGLAPDEWNGVLAQHGVDGDCAVFSGAADPEDDALRGASLTGIAFDPSTGHFFLDLALDPADALGAPDATHDVSYSAAQNASYVTGDGKSGATTSGDTVPNTAEVLATTSAIDALDGVTAAGGAAAGGVAEAWDDSRAVLTAQLSGLRKDVLRRSAGVPDAADIASAPRASDWVPEADEPFTAGDEVWYRISIDRIRGEGAAITDIRNPKFTDFLPPGVAFDDADRDGDGRPDDIRVVPSSTPGLGSCAPADEAAWLDTFVPAPAVNGSALTFSLGSAACYDSTDRFLPLHTRLDLYIKVRVTGVSPAGTVDLPQNLAKYQQENVDGEIFFLRDAAEIELDQAVTLVKGIRANTHPGSPSADQGFGSNVDGERVVQGDRVTFRLDVTAPRTATRDYTVWDALPEGVRAADVDPASTTAALVEAGAERALSSGFAAEVLDPGDAGYPADLKPSLAGRSVIVWTVSAEVPGSTAASESTEAVERGLTLGYTLVVPAGVADGGPAAQLTQRYRNDASIVSYAAATNGGDASRLVPQGPDSLALPRSAEPGEYLVEDPEGTTGDASDVVLPGAGGEKVLVSSEIGGPTGSGDDGAVGEHDLDPRNAGAQIVQGEHATFRYSATVPAHTSVSGARLADDGVLRSGATTVPFEYVPGSASFSVLDGAGEPVPGFDWTGFTRVGDPAGGERAGTLLFPGTYTNATSEPQTFVVSITGWVRDRDASHPTATPNLANGQWLENRARFTWDDPSAPGERQSVEDTARAQYREPSLAIAKAASPNRGVAPGQRITFTLTVTNTASAGAASYDHTVVDTVPAGLRVDTAPLAAAGAAFAPDEAALRTGAGGTVTWSPEQFAQLRRIPASATLSYTATIDPTTGGGREYVNAAEVRGHTLPATLGGEDTTGRRGDRVAKASATVTAQTAVLAKGVRLTGGSAYGPSVSAPIGDTVEYELRATLHAGINYYDVRLQDRLPAGVRLIDATVEGPTAAPADAVIDDPASWAAQASGTTRTWRYTASGGDLLASDVERTLTLRYRVQLADAVAFDVNSLPNTAQLLWNAIDGRADSERSAGGTARVAVTNPALGLVKEVKLRDEPDGAFRSGATADPDARLDYRLTVANTGTAPAYGVTITDDVPAGVRVDPGTISHDGVLSGGDPDAGGGTITWTIAGPVATGTGEALVLRYGAAFADAEHLDGSARENAARVTGYASFPEGGRAYAPGERGTPPASDEATATPIFPSVALEKRVSDGDLARVGEAFGWTLRLVNTGAGAAQRLDVTDVLPKHWSYDAGSARISVGGAPAVPLAEPVTASENGGDALTWNLGSIAPAVPTLPGTSSGATEAQRSVVITFTATPGADAVLDAGTGYRDAGHAHTNTLRALATDTSGATEHGGSAGGAVPHAGGPDTADAFLGAADLGITKRGAEQPLVAGTNGTGWTIAVSNAGPDAAEGPITVRDTSGPLPAGVTVTGAAGDGWTCAVPERADDGATAFECARSDAGEPLAAGSSFPPIAVAVAVAAAQPPVVVENAAVVRPGRTHDPEPADNRDEDPLRVESRADLTLEKTAATAAPTAGEALSWTLRPRNAGPSVSVSTGDRPVTVVDTVPEGMVEVGDPSTADWTATVANAGNAFPARAGDVITWTYTGRALDVGPAPVITLSGRVDPGWIGGAEITNTAAIRPGGTTDPEPGNNADADTVAPGDATAIGVAKTRVVEADGAWKDASELGAPLPGVVAGEPVHYRVTVAGRGPASARDVRVVDTPPPGLSFRSLANEGSGTWTRAAGPGAGQDTFALDGALPPGETRSFITSYDASPTLAVDEEVVNRVRASAGNATTEPEDDDSTRSERQADLSIAKSHAGDAVAGGTIAYELVVTNRGPSAASGAIPVTDALPPGFSYAAGTSAVAVGGAEPRRVEPEVTTGADGRQILAWEPVAAGEELAVGDTVVISLTAHIAADVPAQRGLVNEASVDGPEDERPGNDVARDPVDVATRADLVLAKDVEAGPWVAGTEVAYTVTVRNDGPSVAEATVRDLLPAGIELVSISGSEGWRCDAASASCVNAAHPVGAGAASTIAVVGRIASSAPDGASLRNLAQLTWSDSRGAHEREDAADVAVTTLADLVLEKTAVDAAGNETARAVAGERARYRVEVRNDGPSDAVAPLEVADVLPEGVSFAGLAAGSSGDWAAAVDADDPRRVTFTRQPGGTGLGSGASAPAIVFDVLVDPAVASGTTLTNTARVTSGTPERDEANNTDTAAVAVDREVDVTVVKTHDPDRVRIGEELPFTLEVSNAGPSTASAVRLTDTVPAGLEVTDAPGDLGTGWTLESVTPRADGTTAVVATLRSELAPGAAAAPLVLTTRVTAAAYPGVVNAVGVEAAEADREPENNRDEDAVRVPALAALTVEKRAIGPLQVGGTGRYRIAVSNAGPTADPGPITVTDALPRGLAFRSSPDAAASVSGGTVTWTLEGGLAVGETAVLTVVVDVGPAAFPAVANVASVASPSGQAADAVLSDTATAAVAAADPLAVTGRDVAALALLAAVLLLLGGASAVLLRLRRRSA